MGMRGRYEHGDEGLIMKRAKGIFRSGEKRNHEGQDGADEYEKEKKMSTERAAVKNKRTDDGIERG